MIFNNPGFLKEMQSRFFACCAAVVLLVGVLFSGRVQAQDLSGVMEQMAVDAAKGYSSPIVDAFGANLHNGWFNRAPGAKIFGLDLKVGLVLSGAFMRDEDLTFATTGVYRFQEDEATDLANSIPGLPAELTDEAVSQIMSMDFQASISGPTVFGSESENVMVATQNQTIVVGGNTYVIPGQNVVLDGVTGLIEDPGIFPHIAPQLTVGTIYGTQATIRYLPDITINDALGKLKFFGFGIQHNPGVWFSNPLPVDISLGYLRQNLKIGTLLDATTSAYALSVSKTFSAILISATPYAGFMLEKTEMTFSYLYDLGGNSGPIAVDFTVEGVNKKRFILGVGVSLLGLNLYADYNIATIKTVSLGVVYGF